MSILIQERPIPFSITPNSRSENLPGLNLTAEHILAFANNKITSSLKNLVDTRVKELFKFPITDGDYVYKYLLNHEIKAKNPQDIENNIVPFGNTTHLVFNIDIILKFEVIMKKNNISIIEKKNNGDFKLIYPLIKDLDAYTIVIDGGKKIDTQLALVKIMSMPEAEKKIFKVRPIDTSIFSYMAPLIYKYNKNLLINNNINNELQEILRLQKEIKKNGIELGFNDKSNNTYDPNEYQLSNLSQLISETEMDISGLLFNPISETIKIIPENKIQEYNAIYAKMTFLDILHDMKSKLEILLFILSRKKDIYMSGSLLNKIT